MATNFVLPDPRRQATRQAQLAYARLVTSLADFTYSLRWLAAFMVPAALLTLGLLAHLHGWRPDALVAAPSELMRTFLEGCRSGELQRSLVAPIGWIVGGGVLGALLGLLVGGGLGLSRAAGRLLFPTLKSVALVPVLIWLPLWFVLLGPADMLTVVIVAQAAWAPVVLKSFEGMTGTPDGLLEMGRALGLSRGQLVWRVVLPAAAPSIWTGIRRGVSGAGATLVAVEIFASLVSAGGGAADIRDFEVLKVMSIAVGSALLVGFALDRILEITEARFIGRRQLGSFAHVRSAGEDSCRTSVGEPQARQDGSAAKPFHGAAIAP